MPHWRSLGAIGGGPHKTDMRVGALMTPNCMAVVFFFFTLAAIGGHWHRWCLIPTPTQFGQFPTICTLFGVISERSRRIRGRGQALMTGHVGGGVWNPFKKEGGGLGKQVSLFITAFTSHTSLLGGTQGARAGRVRRQRGLGGAFERALSNGPSSQTEGCSYAV